MKVLVVGGAGYIGSHCAAMLISRGHNVVILDDLSTGRKELIAGGAKFILGDITENGTCQNVMKEIAPDAVIHLAAKSIVEESMKKPIYYWQQNLVGTINLLKAMNECDVRIIIFSSTAAVYGNTKISPIDENTETNPVNTYGNTKLACERLISDVARSSGLKYFILRYFNVAGADFGFGPMFENETRLIPLAVKCASGKNRSLEIFGNDYPTPDGTCIRDYIHVSDIAEAHILALEYLVNNGESQLCNLGSNKGYSVLEIIDTTKKITGVNFPVKIVGRRAGDPAKVIASNEKARKLLGWTPKRGLEKIIKSEWEWEQKLARR